MRQGQELSGGRSAREGHGPARLVVLPQGLERRGAHELHPRDALGVWRLHRFEQPQCLGGLPFLHVQDGQVQAHLPALAWTDRTVLERTAQPIVEGSDGRRGLPSAREQGALEAHGRQVSPIDVEDPLERFACLPKAAEARQGPGATVVRPWIVVVDLERAAQIGEAQLGVGGEPRGQHPARGRRQLLGAASVDAVQSPREVETGSRTDAADLPAGVQLGQLELLLKDGQAQVAGVLRKQRPEAREGRAGSPGIGEDPRLGEVFLQLGGQGIVRGRPCGVGPRSAAAHAEHRAEHRGQGDGRDEGQHAVARSAAHAAPGRGHGRPAPGRAGSGLGRSPRKASSLPRFSRPEAASAQ